MATLRVVRHADPAGFWDAAERFLARDEIGNTQLLALGSRYAEEPGDSPPSCFTVGADGSAAGVGSSSAVSVDRRTPEADSAIAGAAIVLPPRGTLFVAPTEGPVLAALIATMRTDGIAVGDIVARRDIAEACARLLAEPYRTHVALELHRLTEVTAAPATEGAMREAIASDFDLLHAWQVAFVHEANIREGADEAANQVRRRLDIGGAWLWEVDGIPVSHAGCRPTPICSARIAPVYTPPAWRGRGYASALVAALSRHLLARGRKPLFLFADAANPTASGIYRRVGFRHVDDHLHLMRVES